MNRLATATSFGEPLVCFMFAKSVFPEAIVAPNEHRHVLWDQDMGIRLRFGLKLLDSCAFDLYMTIFQKGVASVGTVGTRRVYGRFCLSAGSCSFSLAFCSLICSLIWNILGVPAF